MSPRLAMDYRPNGVGTDSEAFGESVLADGPRRYDSANLTHLVFGQHRTTVAHTMRSVVSAFNFTVPHVVRSRSREQMRRVEARRVVAGVQYIHPFRDGVDENLIGNSMDFLKTASKVRMAVRMSSWSAGLCTRPHPTLVLGLVRDEISEYTENKWDLGYTGHVSLLARLTTPGVFAALPGISMSIVPHARTP